MTLFEQMFDTRAMGEIIDRNPAVPVLILIDGHWWPGKLDKWTKEHDGWYGRAELTRTGTVNWYPAIALRKAEE